MGGVAQVEGDVATCSGICTIAAAEDTNLIGAAGAKRTVIHID